MMDVIQFLGSRIDNLLESEPFKDWNVERSIEDALEEPRVFYVFPNRGLQIRCCSLEKIRVIFLDDNCKDISKLLKFFSFSQNRSNILDSYGHPSKSGEKSSHPVLGKYGPWDRFARESYTIHFAYYFNSDTIKRVTIMENEFVP